MRAAVFLSVVIAASPVAAGSVGGVIYATQYDYAEFAQVANSRPFPVELAGQPWGDAGAAKLLEALNAGRPRRAGRFTLERPAEPARPDYRLVLVFNAANSLGSASVCQGARRFQTTAAADRLDVFAVYCRNDQALAETTARGRATTLDDPDIASTLRDMLASVFNSSPALDPRGKLRAN